MRRIINFVRHVSIARRITAVYFLLLFLLVAEGAVSSVEMAQTLGVLERVASEYAVAQDAMQRHLAGQQAVSEMALLFRDIHTQLEEYQRNQTRLPIGALGGLLVQKSEDVIVLAEAAVEASQDERMEGLVSIAEDYHSAVDLFVSEAEATGGVSVERVSQLQLTLMELERRVYGSSADTNRRFHTTTQQTTESLQADTEAYLMQRQQQARGFLALAALLVLMMSAAFYIAVSSIIPPLRALQEGAQAIAEGERDQRIPETGADEMTAVTRAFNQMAGRVIELVESLEVRVSERTRALEVVAEIGHETTHIRSMEVLLERVTTLIRQRLEFDHVQIFLLDDIETYAVLRASTGDVGRRLLAEGHKVRVGSPSLVGQATARNETLLATEETARRLGLVPDPLLPDIRAQIALPLHIGGRIIGALDMQSRHTSAFRSEDLRTFETLADQLATAIDSTRLVESTRAQMHEIERLQRQLTRRTWSEFAETEAADMAPGYYYNLSQTRPLEDEATFAADGGIAVPIRLGGEVIGTLNAARPGEMFSTDEQAVVQAVAERLGLAIENARLFQSTQRAFQEMSVLYEGSGLINAAETFDDILTALRKGSLMRDAYMASIDLFETLWQVDESDRPEHMQTVAFWASFETTRDPTAESYRLDRFPVMSHLTPEEPFVVEDVTTDERIGERLRAFYMNVAGVRSVVYVPLVVGSEWLGWVMASRQEPTVYTETQMRRLTSLCAQAAVSIQSQLRFQQTQARAERERVIRSISDQMQSAPDIDTLMQIAAEELNRALGGSQTVVQLGTAFDRDQHELKRQEG